MDHWEGLPDGILGLWEYPLETFFGPAAVCYLDQLEPVEQEDEEGEEGELVRALAVEEI